MKDLWLLFITFCRIGAFTFGGGYAMLPMIQKEIVDNRKWAAEEDIINYYAIGQCTPGVIAVNTATFIGYNKKGILGAVFATAGVVMPSIIIIMVIAAFIQNFADIPAVQYAFSGIRVAVVVLILNAIVKLWKAGVKGVKGVVIFLCTIAASLLLKIPTALIIVIIIAMALIIEAFQQRREARK